MQFYKQLQKLRLNILEEEQSVDNETLAGLRDQQNKLSLCGSGEEENLKTGWGQGKARPNTSV